MIDTQHSEFQAMEAIHTLYHYYKRNGLNGKVRAAGGIDALREKDSQFDVCVEDCLAKIQAIDAKSCAPLDEKHVAHFVENDPCFNGMNGDKDATGPWTFHDFAKGYVDQYGYLKDFIGNFTQPRNLKTYYDMHLTRAENIAQNEIAEAEQTWAGRDAVFVLVG